MDPQTKARLCQQGDRDSDGGSVGNQLFVTGQVSKVMGANMVPSISNITEQVITENPVSIRCCEGAGTQR